ncbi:MULTISPECIES: MBL fold metallo-hydrolase [Auritidibacter]|uniref:MBL fold metallo-hydrolase n=1 Tax=Auritidibacter ignavus TaxID=678932 RepID=A0AAJ6DCY4_9MICC|nr:MULTISPECIES: MBL fold metallo-hydrolase [Auritidibacter]AXR73439.1 MBL fold metallo-hydrolase [Auritidibacter sp. NML130574]NIH70757.1 glyoxylase-like metal-dependent hydrolase (beta-lactamase superfamily II) [Auritidibacter ignavus]PXA77703.1 Zn-dependent hydrolase [Auritidibacter sp. NML100628]PXA80340.1 Zn-dependent hydrolase [Auritidibacter sp. NML120636]RMX23061.1 MBL fold metallo-hydrolase [Auritidibacter ignavus]
MTARIDHLETSGTFSLDGETHQVDNNVWIVGNSTECIIIDPAHDANAVHQAVQGRNVAAILLTHGHDDHISEALTVRDFVDAPVLLNAEDRMLWDAVYPVQGPDGSIQDGDTFTIAGVTLTAFETPGHSPGSTCFYSAELEDGQGAVFTGDTLFAGGPGATGGRSYTSFDAIIKSISEVLLELPESTRVLTGHGESSTIGTVKPHLQEWIDRGY